MQRPAAAAAAAAFHKRFTGQEHTIVPQETGHLLKLEAKHTGAALSQLLSKLRQEDQRNQLLYALAVIPSLYIALIQL